MAKLTIEIEENGFALYDVSAYLNGELVYRAGNCTSENGAYNEASLALKGWIYHD